MSLLIPKDPAETVKETLKLKTTPVDEWNLREQLALAIAVRDSGSQNWASIARTLKHQLEDEDRPADWYLPKNCTLQYNKLLGQVEKPARKKKRPSGQGESLLTMKVEKVETHEEAIVRHLKSKRIQQLKMTIEQEASLIKAIESDLSLLQKSDVTDEEIARIEDSVRRDEEEELERNIAKDKWLKEREDKKKTLELKIKCLGAGIEPVRISILNKAASVQSSSSPDSDVDIVTKLAKIDKPEVVATQKTDKPVGGARSRNFRNGTPKADSEETKTDVLEIDSESKPLDKDTKIDSEEADSEFAKTDSEKKVDSEATEIRTEEEMSVDTEETISEEDTKMVDSESSQASTENVDTSNLVDESELNDSNKIVDQIVADIVSGIKMVDNEVTMVDTKVEETTDRISSVEDIEITEKDVCEQEVTEKIESEALVAIDNESEDSRQTTEVERQSKVIDQVRNEEYKSFTSSEEHEEIAIVEEKSTYDSEDKRIEISSSQKEIEQPKEVFETSKNIENEVEIHLETSAGNLEAEQAESMEVDVETEVPSDVATTENVIEAADNVPQTDTQQTETPDISTDVKVVSSDVAQTNVPESTENGSVEEVKIEQIDEEAVEATLSTDNVYKNFSRPIVKKEPLRRTYSRKEEWAEDEQDSAASNSASNSVSNSEEETETSEGVRKTRARRKSEIATPSSATDTSVEVAQVNPEDDEKARKEWRRQATAVVNNAKFNRSLSKYLAPVKDNAFNEMVKFPKTLRSISRDIELGQIRTTEDLRWNMSLLFTNIAMFYRTNTEEYERLKFLYDDFQDLVNKLMLNKDLPTTGYKRASLPNMELPSSSKKRRR